MKQLKTAKSLLILVSTLSILTACESGPRVRMAPGYERTEAPAQAQADIQGTPFTTSIPPTPTVQPLTLDRQLYTLPSQVFSFNPPQRWDLVSEDDNYVKFSREDSAAWFEAALESSGYPLSDEAFQKYAENMLNALYAGTEEYALLGEDSLPGRVTVTSTLLKNNLRWYTMDHFMRQDRALILLSFHAHESVWDAYQPAFRQIIDSLRTRTGYLKDDLVKEDGSALSAEEIASHTFYLFSKIYKSPHGAFEMKVPLGWGVEKGAAEADGREVETISSPDGEATIEIVTFAETQGEEAEDIGIFSTSYLKDRYGSGWERTAYALLDDGRIRFDWQERKSGLTGYSTFWNQNNRNIILSFQYTGAHTGLYAFRLNIINNSTRLIKSLSGT